MLDSNYDSSGPEDQSVVFFVKLSKAILIARSDGMKHIMLKDIQSKVQGTWCLVTIANEELRAKIAHIGRGKFLVIEEESGEYSNVIDASDVLHCRE
jgi:hypothetical protein